MELKWRHFINLHKAMTPFVVLSLIWWFKTETFGAYLYIAMHSTYAMCWLMKELWYPDRSWMQPISFVWCVLGFFGMMIAYWASPFLICRANHEPSNLAVLVSVSSFGFGLFFTYGSDCQKHFTLKLKKGLITDGFFTWTRNPNYLGEIMIYSGFAGVSGSIYPFLFLAGVIAFLFYPNMLRKDQSMSRHEEFKAYKERTGLLIPHFWKKNESSEKQD